MLTVFREAREAVKARRERKQAAQATVPRFSNPPSPWMYDQSSRDVVADTGPIPRIGQRPSPVPPDRSPVSSSLPQPEGVKRSGNPLPDRVWSGPVEPVGVRRFRRVVMVGVVVLSVAGLLSIVHMASRVVAAAGGPEQVPAVQVPDMVLAGVAEQAAVDYLSFDEADRPRRAAVLARYVRPGTRAADGWDGVGRQSADEAAVVGLARDSGSSAMVSVRVRAIPQVKTDAAAAAAPTSSSVPPPVQGLGPAGAVGPVGPAAGWSGLRPRWLTVAVPVEADDAGVWMAGVPGLVGSPVQSAIPPAVPGGDGQVTAETKASAEALAAAYAASDLGYARATGAAFSGLDRAATVRQVADWSAAAVTDPAARHGNASITWVLEGGAGLTASYRLDLAVQHGKTYLAGVTPVRTDRGVS